MLKVVLPCMPIRNPVTAPAEAVVITATYVLNKTLSQTRNLKDGHNRQVLSNASVQWMCRLQSN